MADVGATTTAKVVGAARAGGRRAARSRAARRSPRAWSSCWPASRAARATDRIDLRHEPTVIMVAGVNGTGKTTTIGKLAWHLRQELGRKVVLGAADTFRAAAVEQLEEWARRADASFVRGAPGSRPRRPSPSRPCARAASSGADVVIVDTAGRLHTQDELMAELAKVRRVIGKQLEGAPHETLLTVDATTGQNGLRQAQLFSRGGARGRHRPDQARRHGQGRDRAGHRRRARAAGEAHRHRRARSRTCARSTPTTSRGALRRPGRLTAAGTAPPGMDAWVFWAIAAVILAVGEVLTVELLPVPLRARARRGGARRPGGRRRGAPGRRLRRPDRARPRGRPARSPAAT